MTSSSPWPAPVRLSPLCLTPNSSWLPKKTLPVCCPSVEKNTTETSRSTSLPPVFAMSQPRPADIRCIWEASGRSMTAPFSIAKATFWRFGALGMTPRMMLPSTGSRMSMKCLPSWAGSLMMRRLQLPVSSLTIDATASTSSTLCSRGTWPTELSLVSSRRCSLPFLTSLRCPRFQAATTNTIIFTLSGSFPMVTQMTSSMPSFAPVLSSPECVTALSALRLL
mmetsp:Transcript_83347/g.258841  ORF Transcript_83347/g.258841 Transcript_83347/m.258841 type:complete len:223 (+) Transcript_83347:591-1259(+)